MLLREGKTCAPAFMATAAQAGQQGPRVGIQAQGLRVPLWHHPPPTRRPRQRTAPEQTKHLQTKTVFKELAL